MAKITIEDFKRIDACDASIEAFRQTFGADETEVTIENAEKYFQAYRGWIYEAWQFISPAARLEWNQFKQISREHEGSEYECSGCKAERAKFVELFNREHDNATRSV